jgi:hypothetical protein
MRINKAAMISLSIAFERLGRRPSATFVMVML